MTAIIVTGEPKEIADLVQTVQDRQVSADDMAKSVISCVNEILASGSKPVLLI